MTDLGYSVNIPYLNLQIMALSWYFQQTYVVLRKLSNAKSCKNTFLMNYLQVWAAFLVSTLAFVCILKLIIYIEQKYANNQQDLTGNFTGLGNVWIYVCSTLTNQGKKSFSFHQLLLNY